MDYDKIFPKYIRDSNNKCYLDAIPNDIVNIIYDYKYDGANFIFDDIINLRIIKNGKNVSDILINENINDFHLFAKKLLVFMTIDEIKEDVLLWTTSYIIMVYVVLYKINFKNDYDNNKKLLLKTINDKLREWNQGECPLQIIKHYIPTFLEQLNKIEQEFPYNN